MDFEKGDQHSVSFTKSTPLIAPPKTTKGHIIPRNISSPGLAPPGSGPSFGSKKHFAESLDNIGRMRLMGSFTGLVDYEPDEQTPLKGSINGNVGKDRKGDDGHAISFEEALQKTKFGKFNYLLILISGTVLTCVLLDTLGLSYVIPVSECDMKLTTQDKGVLSGVGFAGIITSSHLWGFLADTRGRRAVIFPTLFIAFFCNAISSVTSTFWLFVLLRFLNGFFVSGSSATIYAYLGEFHTIKNRSRAIMWASVIFGMTCVLLPLIAWAVINQEWELYISFLDLTYKPWRMYLIVCGIPSFVCAVSIYFMPESPKFTLAQGKQKETIEILQWLHKVNNPGCKEPLMIGALIEEREAVESRKQAAEKKNGVLKSMWGQTAPLFMQPHLRKTLLACTVQFGTFVTSSGMYMWFPDILNRLVDFMENHPNEHASLCQILDWSKQNISIAMAANETKQASCTTKLEIATFEHSIVLELLYASGFAFIGVIINRVGKLPILLFILYGCGISGIVTVYVNTPILAVYLYLILLLCGVSITVVNAATVDLVPTNLRAMAVCISLMLGRLGSMVGSNVVGLLLDNHCHEAFIFAGTMLMICGCLAFFIPNIRDRDGKEPEPQVVQDRRSISAGC